ncbi:MAG: prolyl oligopeptidase family serine peptidase [Anaerolineae bacterium]
MVAGYFVMGTIIYNQISQTSAFCGRNSDDHDNTPSHFVYTSRDLDPTPYQMPTYEDVSFPSRNSPNITIAAWFVPAEVENPNDAPVVILVHGLGSCKASEHILTAAGMLHRNGFNTLLIDLRDHGDSTVEDGRFAGGTDEHLDVLGAWDWLVNERGFSPERIGLLGQSLGAATVIIATGEEPRVAAVWEDSGFADINVAIQAELTRYNFPTFFANSATLMGQIIANDNIGQYSPLAEVQKLNGRPIYITHGTADTRLSVQYAYDLAAAVNAAGGSVEPWIIDGAGHVEAIFLQPDEYERRMVEFFNAALGVSSS